MESWIRGLVDAAESRLASFARAISDRIVALYSWVAATLTNAKAALGRLASAIGNAGNYIISTASETYLTIRWAITIRAPALIKAARDEVISWATGIVLSAETKLRALVSTLDRWATAAVNSVTNLLTTFREWATERINATIETLTKTATLVYSLLTIPSRLASWLVAAMVDELWRYADRNADRIAQWARARSVSFVTSNIARIEGIISRLL